MSLFLSWFPLEWEKTDEEFDGLVARFVDLLFDWLEFFLINIESEASSSKGCSIIEDGGLSTGLKSGVDVCLDESVPEILLIVVLVSSSL